MNAGQTNNIVHKNTFWIPAYIMLSMLMIQAIYLIWFFSDIGDARTFVILNCFGASMILLGVTSLASLITYWIGFFRQSSRERIFLALLLVCHFCVAYCSFAVTVMTAISRC